MRPVYLPEEDATVLAEVQSVAVLLPHWVVLLQREVHELPVHVVAGGEDQVVAELHAIDTDEFSLIPVCCMLLWNLSLLFSIFIVSLSVMTDVITNKMFYDYSTHSWKWPRTQKCRSDNNFPCGQEAVTLPHCQQTCFNPALWCSIYELQLDRTAR